MNFTGLFIVQSHLDSEQFGRALDYVKSLPTERRTYLPQAKAWVVQGGAPGSDELVQTRQALEAVGWKIKLFTLWPDDSSFKQKKGMKALAYLFAFNLSLRPKREKPRSGQGF